MRICKTSAAGEELRRVGNSVGNKATHGVLLERTAHPGVYRRGRQYVAVYRRDGRQRKESAATFAEARAIKLVRDAEASEQRRGPTLHDYALRWVARHAGSGHDTVREQTREEYRWLLATFALSYFPADVGSPTSTGECCRASLAGSPIAPGAAGDSRTARSATR
jgi:hypothetical protein